MNNRKAVEGEKSEKAGQAVKPVLVIFAGLPGVGKSTVAKELAQRIGAAYIRIDTIEQAIKTNGPGDLEINGLGYAVGYQLAEDNLMLGLSVVADSVNPWELTRDEWRACAKKANAPTLDIEVICSCPEEHRLRVETREIDVPGLTPPSWAEVVGRDYRPWTTEHWVIDTLKTSPQAAVDQICTLIEALTAAARNK